MWHVKTKHRYHLGDCIPLSIIAYKRLKKYKPKLVEGWISLDYDYWIDHTWVQVKNHSIDLTWNQFNQSIKEYVIGKTWQPTTKQQKYPFAWEG